MRGVIIKESLVLKNAMNGEFTKRVSDTIRVVAKYYCGLEENKECSKDDIIMQVNSFMEENYKDYSQSKWIDKIKQIVQSVRKLNNYNIIDVDKVTIYQDEMEMIMKLETEILQRLAFALLIYQKVYLIKNNKSNGWVNVSLSYLFMESNIRLKEGAIAQKKLLNELYKLNYINQKNTSDCSSLKIEYASKTNDCEVIKIDSFNDIISYFYEYKHGIKYKKCINCGDRVKLKTPNSRIKYCKKCAKIINLENTKESKKYKN